MRYIRIAGFVVLALVAVGAFFAVKPASSLQTRQDQIAAVLDNGAANEVKADTAPKQQVVTGWSTRDLIAVQTSVNTDAVAGLTRIAYILIIGVFAICWHGATLSMVNRQTEGSENTDEIESSDDAVLPT